MTLYRPLKIKNKITIVIPCYNEDKYIKKTIDSIYKQVLIDGTKVIIADNHSTDRTRGIINNLSNMYSDRLKIQMIDGGRVAQARKFNEEYHHSEDFGLSKKYNPRKFKIFEHYVGQDDRRFKKMGYLGMVKLLIKSFFNRKNEEYFKKDIGYW